MAEKSGWDKPFSREKGRGRGVAVQESFGSVVAQVAEVSVEGDTITVDRKHRDPLTVKLGVRFVILSNELPRVRQLLAQDGGVGSAAVYSSHKLLPYFGFRRPGSVLASMDHAAPIFA